MLLVIDGEAVEHSQLAQMEDAVDAVVAAESRAHQVTGDVQDDEALQVLQLRCLLDVVDEIVAYVELHEAGKIFEAIKARNLVILK